MTWTIVDDVNDRINVRAVLHVPTQQDEIRALIAALEQRLPREKPDDREPTGLRGPDRPRGGPAGTQATAETAKAALYATAHEDPARIGAWEG